MSDKVIIQSDELEFTPEQLEYYEQEMRKFKLPAITRLHKLYGVPFIRYTFLPAIILIAILGIIYSNSRYGLYEWMWTFDKAIALFYIFGFGLFTLTSFICEKISVNRLRKRLGLTQTDFNILVIAFQITDMTN